MTAQEVLKAVATMPQEELLKIQEGIAELIAARFSPEEWAEIRAALDEAEAEIERGETFEPRRDKETFRASVTVRYTRRSLRDVEEIRTFISNAAADGLVADQFIAKLLQACLALKDFPGGYLRYPSAPRWRVKAFGNYLILFEIRDDGVYIGHIRHSARQPLRG